VLSLRESSRSYGWSSVEKWRVDHVWGRDKDDNAFSWAKLNGDKDAESPEARDVTWDSNAQIFTVVTPMASRGLETEEKFSGEVTLTKRFSALPNGLNVDTEIQSSSADEIKELWLTLPVYEGGFEAENSMPNQFVVDIWQTNCWTTLTSAVTTSSQVRIGHVWGGGFVYTYVTLDGQHSVRLLPADTDIDFQKIHLLQIDLHGDPGTLKTIPSNTSVTYDLTADGVTSEDNDPGDTIEPGTFSLEQNFPNPFREKTVLTFEVPNTSNVDLSVFDTTGRRVSQLLKDIVPLGTHSITWNTHGLASGTYLIRLRTETGVLYKQATLLN
jgi:hypothetical protein